jgi:hypothetical protein
MSLTDLTSYICGTITVSEPLFERYHRLEDELEGKWFALSEDGKVLVVADSNERLWKKIHAKLGRTGIRAVIGYSPTKEEKKAACLFLLKS